MEMTRCNCPQCEPVTGDCPNCAPDPRVKELEAKLLAVKHQIDLMQIQATNKEDALLESYAVAIREALS